MSIRKCEAPIWGISFMPAEVRQSKISSSKSFNGSEVISASPSRFPFACRVLQVVSKQFDSASGSHAARSISKWLNEETTFNFWRARVTATFSLRRPPSGINGPKRRGRFPARSLP